MSASQNLAPQDDTGDSQWWVDGHLDLAMRHLHGPSILLPVVDRDACCVSIPALRQGHVRLMLGTIFTEVGEVPDTRWGYASHADTEGAHAVGVRQLQIYLEMERAGHIRIVRTRADLEAAAAGSVPGIVILMEGADPIRAPDEAEWWYAQGVRVVGMTWGRGSRYAGGNSTGGELTSRGHALVAHFDRLGVLHDASHLSDAAFAGLCGATRERIVASHSNARALLEPNERHLTDDQIAQIAARDGLVGLNLFGKFLAKNRPATLNDALNHVEHIAQIAGRHRTCVGSDFDGGFKPTDCATGCQRPQELGALTHGLAERGWSADECDGFAHANWMRILRDVLS